MKFEKEQGGMIGVKIQCHTLRKFSNTNTLLCNLVKHQNVTGNPN